MQRIWELMLFNTLEPKEGANNTFSTLKRSHGIGSRQRLKYQSIRKPAYLDRACYYGFMRTGEVHQGISTIFESQELLKLRSFY